MKIILILLFLLISLLSADESELFKAFDFYKKGMTLYEKYNFEEAHSNLTQALNINNNLTFANILIGNIYYKNSHYSNAIKQYQIFLNNPYDQKYTGYTYLNISKSYRKLKNYSNAMVYLLKAKDFQLVDQSDYYYEALSHFTESRLLSKKINEEYFNEIMGKAVKYTNSHFMQNNLGRFHLYNSKYIHKNNRYSQDVIDSLDLAYNYFTRATKLDNKNFIYFNNLYQSVFQKGEFYREFSWKNIKNGNINSAVSYFELAISNYRSCIKLIENNKIFVNNKDMTLHLSQYKKLLEETERFYKIYQKKL